jgi:hypothetical protein
MNNQNYAEKIVKKSREKFTLMREKMLAPIRQIQQKRKENLKNLLNEIEKKEQKFQAKKVSLEKLCRE